MKRTVTVARVRRLTPGPQADLWLISVEDLHLRDP